MTIAQGFCNSYKVEVQKGQHDLETDVIKMALYTSAADLDKDTIAYSATDEVSGTGYTAGGETMTSVAVTLDGDSAIIDFDDVVWSATTAITARGALIYNSSQANKAIAVLDFEYDISSTSTFTVQPPAPAESTAIAALS